MKSKTVTRRGRPKMDVKERRQKIIESARAVFLEKGPLNTRVEDIVAKGHMSKAVFYEFFSGKEELFACIVSEFFQRLKDSFNYFTEDTVGPETDLFEFFHGRATLLSEQLVEDRESALLILQSGYSMAPHIQEEVEGYFRDLRFLMEKLLNKAINFNLLMPLNTHLASYCILGSIERVYLGFLKGEIQDPPDKIVSDVVALYFPFALTAG